MIVRYVGVKIKQRKGCPVCGGRGSTRYKVDMTHTYYTPSGVAYKFRLGESKDIPDGDAEFLISLGGGIVGGG